MTSRQEKRASCMSKIHLVQWLWSFCQVCTVVSVEKSSFCTQLSMLTLRLSHSHVPHSVILVNHRQQTWQWSHRIYCLWYDSHLSLFKYTLLCLHNNAISYKCTWQNIILLLIDAPLYFEIRPLFSWSPPPLHFLNNWYFGNVEVHPRNNRWRGRKWPTCCLLPKGGRMLVGLSNSLFYLFLTTKQVFIFFFLLVRKIKLRENLQTSLG